jgi:hypothetical protein
MIEITLEINYIYSLDFSLRFFALIGIVRLNSSLSLCEGGQKPRGSEPSILKPNWT